MKDGVRFSIAGTVLLLALAGCGRGFLQYGEEREPWRHEAEVACLKSGTVKLGAGVVQMRPIEGPGMCGADFPLKVAVLGESTAMSYLDEDMRPPAGIPNTSGAQPRWPANEPRYAPAAPVRPVQTEPMQGQPAQGQMRWVPGPPGIEQPENTTPASRPMSINPPGVAQPDDIPDDAILPPGRNAPTYQRTQPTYNAPVYQSPQRNAPALGPMRGPNATAAIMPAAVTPAATLACPLVSALDRWVTEGVQPAALHWFGTQVSEIKQISAYSCRGMVGAGTSHISEHAFGNALDVAAFTLADGRRVTVKDGWHGTPEEQGFLHDVQLYACETFTTVLAPGYNAAHYDHIHVDLMRRESGRHPCRPNAVPGEEVAARVRAVYASKQRGPTYTGSVTAQTPKSGTPPIAVPGEDGYVADEDDDAVTGSIAAPAPQHTMATPGADGDFDDHVTGAVAAPPSNADARLHAPGDDAIRAEERRSAVH